MRVALALLALLLCSPTRSQATTLVVARWQPPPADVVAVARVGAIAPRWRQGRIVSDVELHDELTGKRLVVTVPGGTVDGVAMRVLGAPRFVTGERALVFLLARAGGHRLAGLAAAKAPIVRDAAGVDWVVLAPSDGGRPARRRLDAVLAGLGASR